MVVTPTAASGFLSGVGIVESRVDHDLQDRADCKVFRLRRHGVARHHLQLGEAEQGLDLDYDRGYQSRHACARAVQPEPDVVRARRHRGQYGMDLRHCSHIPGRLWRQTRGDRMKSLWFPITMLVAYLIFLGACFMVFKQALVLATPSNLFPGGRMDNSE